MTVIPASDATATVARPLANDGANQGAGQPLGVTFVAPDEAVMRFVARPRVSDRGHITL